MYAHYTKNGYEFSARVETVEELLPLEGEITAGIMEKFTFCSQSICICFTCCLCGVCIVCVRFEWELFHVYVYAIFCLSTYSNSGTLPVQVQDTYRAQATAFHYYTNNAFPLL